MTTNPTAAPPAASPQAALLPQLPDQLLAQLPPTLPPEYQAQLTAALQLHHDSMAHLLRTCLAIQQAQSHPATRAPDTPATAPADALPRITRRPTPPTAAELAEWLAEYQARYTFPLGRLLQILPEQIANQPRLSTEQGQMCHVVAHLAAQAATTLRQGMAQVQAMLTAKGSRTEAAAARQVQALLDYCRDEADFWQECQIDYDDAASNLAWVVG